MNKAEAIRGNMNASKEETAVFLRNMGIASLQQRAGEMGGETKAKAPDSIQVFSKKKKISLSRRIWQKWVYDIWLRQVLDLHPDSGQNFYANRAYDLEYKGRFSQSKQWPDWEYPYYKD